MEDHTITHIEIPAPDLAKAVSFYSKIFKWKIEIINENSYAYFIIGNTNTGGGLDSSLKPSEGKHGVQVVIDVDDIDQTLKKIEDEGGSVTMAKTEIAGGHGFYACFIDPNKNHLQIHSRQ
ncbi:MAG: VOC family protein [Bacteroidota bacterium]|nr:VOC family protein [Bacteroidota bacterium]